jgi:hypothetical protein
MEAPLLANVWPEVADELRESLLGEGETELAEQVANLRLVGACGCGDDFCQSIRTTAPRQADRTISFADGGLFAVDIDSNGNIVYVEILHREDLKDRYRELEAG